MAVRHFYLGFIGVGCALSLAACGMQGSSHSDAPSIHKNDQAAAAMGPPAGLKTAAITPASSSAVGPPAPIADKLTPSAPPNANGPPADTAWNDPLKTPATFSDTAPAPSLVAPSLPSPMDAAATADMNRRIDKLEGEVAQMHDDMNMMMPALTKLVAAQQDLQQILARMDTAAGTPASAPIPTGADNAAMPGNPKTLGPPVPMQASAPQPLAHDQVPPPAPSPADATPAPVPTPPPVADISEPSKPSTYQISDIRFGEHSQMTRVVLDASGKVPYTYALDDSGTLMTLHLPETAWKAAAQAVSSTSALIDSYTAVPDGQGGYTVAIKLKHPARVSWSDVMTASAEGGFRVVLDLTPKT